MPGNANGVKAPSACPSTTLTLFARLHAAWSPSSVANSLSVAGATPEGSASSVGTPSDANASALCKTCYRPGPNESRTTRWERFTLFLRIPGAPVDNSLAERMLNRGHSKAAIDFHYGGLDPYPVTHGEA